MSRPAPTVVKLGGSHALSAHLRAWIEAIAGCAGDIVLVPGGGPFADAVRDAQPKMGFDDDAAHRMALLAMEQYGCALASLNRALVPADSEAAIGYALEAGRIPVWMPSRMALAASDIATSWDVTSDSLAAWLAGRISARQLLLVKHVAPGDERASLQDLAARGIVDAAFTDFVARAGVPVVVLGPDDQASLTDIVRHQTSADMQIGDRRVRMD